MDEIYPRTELTYPRTALTHGRNSPSLPTEEDEAFQSPKDLWKAVIKIGLYAARL